MAGNNEEISVINHLLKVEKEAYTLIDEAVKDSEAKVSSVRSECEEEFKNQFSLCEQKIKAEYEEKLSALSTEHDTLFNEYKNNLTNQPQNKQSFNELLDNLLFASEQ